MKIAICEDSREDAAHLQKLLNKSFHMSGFEAEIEIFAGGEALLEAFTPGKYQIIFQDIYLKKNGISGMRTAEMIRGEDSEVSIIFTTKSVEHAPASYEVKADYYIVKPVDKERLENALDRCRAQLDRYARTIDISTNWQTERIRLRDVYYAEVMKNNIILHTMYGAIMARMPFGELLNKLYGSAFIRCHRSYAVNLIHVADMRDSHFVLKYGGVVPITRTYATQAQQAFKRFIFDSGG